MQSPTSAVTRGLSIIIFLLFLPNIFTAQVKIKEKIEIAPKIKNSIKVNSSSKADTIIPLLFYEANTGFIMTTHPCQINGFGSINYDWGEGGIGYSVMSIPGDGWNGDWDNHTCYLIWNTNIYDTPVSFEIGGCSRVYVEVYRGGAPGTNVLPGQLGANDSVTFMSEFAWAIVNATRLPKYELDSCSMTAYQTSLDANDYGIHQAFIHTFLYNGSGGPFDICPFYNPPLSIKFTIENPRDGMTIRGSSSDGSGTMIEGTSIECFFSSTSYIWFTWDGSDIPKEIDTVSIRAEAYGVSAVQKIQLKKIIPHHFTVTPDVNPIYAGESVVVRAIAKNSNNEEAALDGGKSITFSDESGIGSFIVGSDTISNKATVTYDQAKSGSIKYYSKLDTSNLVDQGVWICVALTEHPERYGYGYLDVMPACPVVSLSESKISPGNTTTVSVMAHTLQGVFPYPSDQMFIVSMDADARYGKLRCIGDSGTSIMGTQLFEFIAADSIDVDSIVVEIQAQPYYGGGSATSIGIVKKDTLRLTEPIMASKYGTAKNIGVVSNEMKRKNIELSMNTMQARLNKESEKKGNEKQRQRLEIGIEKLKAQLAYETAKTPAERQRSLANLEQIAMLAEDGASCNPSAKVTIKGPKLVVYPLDGEDNTQKITGTDPPHMPKPIIIAQLRNFEDGIVAFHWNLKIEWPTAEGDWWTPQNDEELYEGVELGNNSNFTNLNIGQILELYGMRGGNRITLHVEASAGGKKYTTPDIQNPFIIKGDNPSHADVKAKIESRESEFALALKSICFLESGHTFHQFNGEGFPLQGGDPKDFGVMQVNNPRQDAYISICDKIIWDWTINVETGANVFVQKKVFASNYHDYLAKGIRYLDSKGNVRYRHPLEGTQKDWYWDAKNKKNIIYNAIALTKEQQMLDAIQAYNKGAYWKWVLDDEEIDSKGAGKWKKMPPNDYVDGRVMPIYNDVNGGNPPDGWND